MATDKRERQKKARQERIERERAEAVANRRRKATRRLGAIAAVTVVILGIIILINRDDDDSVSLETTDPAATAPEAAPADEPPATTVATESAPEATTAIPGDAVDPVCPPDDGATTPVRAFTGPPPTCIDESARYEARLDTSAGEIVMELDPALDPVSVNNFVFLARWGYYDGSTFHRIINDFVIQGGDPVGDPPGTGGPGYDFTGGTPDAPETGNAYEIGDVAMANRGDPSSNGAQFFIITGPNGAGLPPLYSPLGRVTGGLDLALELQAVETGPGDQPIEDIVVNTITVTEIAA